MTPGYTTRQAALLLGLSPDTVRRQIARGRLQAFRVGRDWIIPGASLDLYRATSLGHPGRPGGHSR